MTRVNPLLLLQHRAPEAEVEVVEIVVVVVVVVVLAVIVDTNHTPSGIPQRFSFLAVARSG